MFDLKERNLPAEESLRRVDALLKDATDSQVRCEMLLFRATQGSRLRMFSQCRQDCEEALALDPKNVLLLHRELRVLWVQCAGMEQAATLPARVQPSEASYDWQTLVPRWAAGDTSGTQDFSPLLRVETRGKDVELVMTSLVDRGTILLLERPLVESDNVTESVLKDREKEFKLAVLNGGRAVADEADLRSLLRTKGRPIQGPLRDKKGLYLCGSLLKTSCAPNCIAFFVGSVLIVIAMEAVGQSSTYSGPKMPTVCWVEPGWDMDVRWRQMRRSMQCQLCECTRCEKEAFSAKYESKEERKLAQHFEAEDIDFTSTSLEGNVRLWSNKLLASQCLLRAISELLPVLIALFSRVCCIEAAVRAGDVGRATNWAMSLAHTLGERGAGYEFTSWDPANWDLLALDCARAWLEVVHMRPARPADENAKAAELDSVISRMLREYAMSAIGAACFDRAQRAGYFRPSFLKWNDEYRKNCSMTAREKDRKDLVEALFKVVESPLWFSCE